MIEQGQRLLVSRVNQCGRQAFDVFHHKETWAQLVNHMDELVVELAALIFNAQAFACCGKRLAWWAPDYGEHGVFFKASCLEQKITRWVLVNKLSNIAQNTYVTVFLNGFYTRYPCA